MWPLPTGMAHRLAHSHSISVRATVRSPDYGTLYDLPVSGGLVTADAGSEVRRTATIAIADPTLWPDHPRAVLSPLGSAMLIEYGVLVGDHVEWVPVFTGSLSDAERDTPITSGPIRVELEDLSALVAQDRFDSPVQTLMGASVVGEITRLIRGPLPSAEVIDQTGSSTVAARIEIERERWSDGVEVLATAIGAEVYADAAGRFVIRRVPQVTDPAVWTVQGGEGGTVVSTRESVTRSRTYNRVIARGERTDGSTPVVGTATDNDPASPTRYGGPLGRRPRFYSSPLLTTVGQCQQAAESILATARGMAAQVTFRTLVNPGLEPGDVILVPRPRGPQAHVIDRVTIPLDAGTAQEIETRSLDLPPEGS